MPNQTKNQTQQFTTITGKTLMSQPIEPLGFTIADILPHGLFILSGSAKVGKSWLALDLCNCVAGGDTIWDYPTTQGEALYLALEDTPKRMRERLAKIAPDYNPDTPTIHRRN
jgi:RecA-family ATPase